MTMPVRAVACSLATLLFLWYPTIAGAQTSQPFPAPEPTEDAPPAPPPSQPPEAGQPPTYAQPPGEQAPPYAEPAPSEQPPPYADPGAQPPYAQPQPGYAEPSPSYATEAPPPPPAPTPSRGSRFPAFSVRVDPLNWLLEGHLFVELELEALDWLTVETVPMFVTNEQPVVFNSVDDLEQSSDGLGPLAGASLGVGFWLDGKAFRGTVLRAGMTFYNVNYATRADQDYTNSAGDVPRGSILDQVTQRQNRLSFLLGSSRRWGIFTLAGAFGLEYELNDDRRCIVRAGTIFVSSTDPEFCDDDELLLASGGPLDAVVAPDAYNIFDALHPFYIAFRFSLGVTFDDL